MKEGRVVEDPILSPQEMCADGGFSMATWRRNYRHKLKIIRLSPRRIGARRSNWRKTLEENTEGGAT
jgi:hypothetical protein